MRMMLNPSVHKIGLMDKQFPRFILIKKVPVVTDIELPELLLQLHDHQLQQLPGY